MIKVVVFDFDGTLVDSNAIKTRAFEDCVAQFKGGQAMLDRALLAGGDRFQILRSVSQQMSPDSLADAETLRKKMLTSFNKSCRKKIRRVRERRGASQVLNVLHHWGCATYVASATPHKELMPQLRDRGWLKLMRGAYGAPISKRTVLKSILETHGIEARQLAMVGDSDDDHVAAIAVGAKFVGITAERRLTSTENFIRLPDLRRLPEVISRFGARRRIGAN